MENNFGAYMDKKVSCKPTKEGELSGFTFAVKDVFAIAEHICSAGNPDWLRTHDKAQSTAPSLKALLKAGARLEGTTVTDELMYSINGENFHYGTPRNPKDPKRIPGGSSSGSAVVAAGGLADFSIGTDTGGSIRIPSSYCGIYGIRPTHGLVSIEGVIPLAKSFDTVGWMAKEASTLAKVGKVLLDDLSSEGTFTTLIFPKDAWELADSETKALYLPILKEMKNLFSFYREEVLAKDGLAEWAETFRMLQGKEIWREHGDWIKQTNPTFGPGIAERFAWASTLEKEDLSLFEEKRRIIIEKMENLLRNDHVLIIPTAPGKPPLLEQPVEQLEVRRTQTFQLCCIAGLAGLPQVNMPLGEIDGTPIGLSIIAGKKQDLKLLEWVENWTKKGRN